MRKYQILAMTTESGMFLVFEGLEGVGKTRLASECASRLREEGRDAVVVPEFSNGEIGRILRRRAKVDPFLRDPDRRSAFTQALLVASDTAFAAEYSIAPLLGRGVVVLKDRYRESVVACQHVGLVEEYGLSFQQAIRRLVFVADLIPVEPDLTLYLEASKETRRNRIIRRRRVFQGSEWSTAEEIMKNREAAYEALMNDYPWATVPVRVSTESDVATVVERMMELITMHLGD